MKIHKIKVPEHPEKMTYGSYVIAQCPRTLLGHGKLLNWAISPKTAQKWGSNPPPVSLLPQHWHGKRYIL